MQVLQIKVSIFRNCILISSNSVLQEYSDRLVLTRIVGRSNLAGVVAWWVFQEDKGAAVRRNSGQQKLFSNDVLGLKQAGVLQAKRGCIWWLMGGFNSCFWCHFGAVLRGNLGSYFAAFSSEKSQENGGHGEEMGGCCGGRKKGAEEVVYCWCWR